MALIPVLIIPLMVMGGFFVNLSKIPYFLYEFLYLSMFKYGFQAVAAVEFSDPSTIDCGDIQLDSGKII